MRSRLASKDIPHRDYEVHEGRRLRVHVMFCGRDGCEARQVWRDNSGSWVTPQKVLAHFANRGWGIGKDRTHDLCPDCMAAERVMQPLKGRPVVTAAMLPPGPMAEPLNDHPLAPPLTPQALGGLRRAQALSPERRREIASMGGRGGNHRGFGRRWHADRSARTHLQKLGVENPQPDLDYRVARGEDGRWRWARINRENPMPDDNIITMRRQEATMPKNESASPARASTLAERKAIRDYLDANYDEDGGRWRGTLSDKLAAESLNLPRAFITDMRVSAFGLDDTNEADALAQAADAETLKRLTDLEGLIAEAMKDIAQLRAKVEGRARL